MGDGELTVPASPVQGIVAGELSGRGGSGAVSAAPVLTAASETISDQVGFVTVSAVRAAVRESQSAPSRGIPPT